jgi:hypothetical protein
MKKDQGIEAVHMDDSMFLILQEQRRAFMEKFGREPGPSDPVFFDPDFDVPTPLTEAKLEGMYHSAVLNTADAFSKNEN